MIQLAILKSAFVALTGWLPPALSRGATKQPAVEGCHAWSSPKWASSFVYSHQEPMPAWFQEGGEPKGEDSGIKRIFFKGTEMSKQVWAGLLMTQQIVKSINPTWPLRGWSFKPRVFSKPCVLNTDPEEILVQLLTGTEHPPPSEGAAAVMVTGVFTQMRAEPTTKSARATDILQTSPGRQRTAF